MKDEIAPEKYGDRIIEALEVEMHDLKNHVTGRIIPNHANRYGVGFCV